MNQGRIWCVVNPTVGLPLFLGSVAITSLIVHYSVLSNTSWIGSYWSGKAKVKVASVEAPTQASTSSDGAAGFTINVTPTKTGDAQTAFVITLAPKAAVVAQADSPEAEAPETLALATMAGK